MKNHSDNEQQIYSSAAQNSSPLVLVDQDGYDITVKSEQENGTLSQAKTVVNAATKKLQEALKEEGLVLKKHEDNIKFLKTQENCLNDTILDLQVTLGKYHSSNRPMTESGNLSQNESELENIQQILKHTNSAAGIVYQLKTRHSTRGSQHPLTKGILGIVATLGKVDDDNISSCLSRYVGTENMLAVVCKTLDSVKAIESYDKEGLVNKNSGIHGLGTSIGQAIHGRFRVICLECLSPYVGAFITNDPQGRLDIQKPRLPDGEVPHGFIDYAVNMIYIDRENLFFVTHDGHGLRETLFYHLFSRVHVYQTKEDMMQAVSLITDGALSLDGGIIMRPGVYGLGIVEEADVKFLKTSGPPCLTADYSAIEDQIKKKEWEKEGILDDLKREQVLLKQAKATFDAKREELIQFLAQSQSPAARDGSILGFQIKSEVKNETSSGN
ncbi:Protein DEFECTIVE IN MERISTEM SILENCING 3 [Heracleum sosnowskyi]|uniref:Protein DEFECTIVE IN MERISTEM SILENCING 3 n=1 Tax=Heracleum sosnowskyi TaxID=360622 RepID=A0AAD8MWD3_9APIA|nr:Protein DEFECTIVE IN MERISTEM SILENCING 3 [Heracleum sosnowskyi]